MRDRAIRYTVHFTSTTRPGYITPAEWRVRSRGQIPGYGKPTEANLAKHVEAFETSTKPGGPNEHLGTTIVWAAHIKDQLTGKILATYRGPSFVVV